MLIDMGVAGGIAALLMFPAALMLPVLAFWLIEAWHMPVTASMDVTPRLLYQRNLLSIFVDGSIVGLIGGLAIVLFNGLGAALVGGLVFGLVGGLWSAARSGAALSLLFTEIAFCLRARRVRFMPLLENALLRQVLRQAGAVYQFRHADLLDRLADQYRAEPTRRGMRT